MVGLVLICLAAVILTAPRCRWLLRDKHDRFAAAMVQGEVPIIPAMIWIAAQEATPEDTNAWGAVLGFAITVLIIGSALILLLGRVAGEVGG